MSKLIITIAPTTGKTLCKKCDSPAIQAVSVDFQHTGVSEETFTVFCRKHMLVDVAVKETRILDTIIELG